MTTNICIYPKKEEKDTKEKLPKHMRIRYWETHELIYLVELWAHYKNDIVSFDENGVVYRKISRHMNKRNYKVTPQDCRRKIRSLNIKFQKELKARENRAKNSSIPKPKINSIYSDILTELQEIKEDSKKWHLFDFIKSSLEAPYIVLDDEEHYLNELAAIVDSEENKSRDPDYRILRKDKFTMKSLLQLRIQNENLENNCELMRKQLMVKKMQLKLMYSHYMSWKTLANAFLSNQLQNRDNQEEEENSDLEPVD